MADWRFSIGNAVLRAANAPAAVSPAAADAILPLSAWRTGYPDQLGAFQWRSDGTYEADLDTNLLASSSARADAPTGWSDFLNFLAGTPGLPANPPDWGNYGGRNPALRFYRPVVEERDVMPGEATKLLASIQWPAAAAGAAGVRVRVVDGWSGRGWNGSAWVDGGVLDSQLVADTWKDIAEQIDADVNRPERSTYYVIIEPIAASYGATTYCYASANGGSGSPALFPAIDTFALVGHNLPAGATVSAVPQPAGTTITLTVGQPSCYAVAAAAQLVQVWRISVSIPAALRPSTPRPIIGEPWLGLVRTWLVGSPIPTFGGDESAPGQIRVSGPRKRQEIVPDSARPVTSLELVFRARDDASFRQVRDEIMRLTRFGADPILLLPDALFEGAGRVYHGRVEDRLAWQVITPTSTGSARQFAMPFLESPFASP